MNLHLAYWTILVVSQVMKNTRPANCKNEHTANTIITSKQFINHNINNLITISLSIVSYNSFISPALHHDKHRVRSQNDNKQATQYPILLEPAHTNTQYRYW